MAPDRALDTLDVVVARARDLTGDDRLEPYARLSEQTRRRLGFLGETVVIALAGGTGVGKSSLLNAIAGTQVVPAGTIRPTTDRPRVWMPASPEPGLTRLLDSLGIDERIGHSGRLDVAIIDLPDFDSIDLGHREIVERLVPRVDAIVWVFDPQKYADRAIHEGYLRPLADHWERFLFVLNQVDLLAGDELDLVRADLITRLAEDGIPEADLFTTVAAGRIAGIDRLVHYFEDRLRAKRLVLAKLAHDLDGAVKEIGEIVGVREGLDFDRRWNETREYASETLAAGLAGAPEISTMERAGRRLAIRSGPVAFLTRSEEPSRPEPSGRQEAAIQTAAGRIDALVTDLAFEAGGFFGTRLRSRFSPREVGKQVRRALEGTKLDEPPAPTPSAWWKAAAVGQWLALIAVIGSIVWAWARPSTLQRGSWPWPVIVGVVALAVGIGVFRLVRTSGTRAGRRAATTFQESASVSVGAQLDRRIGVDLRTVLRDRAELAGLLTELSIEAAKLEATLPAV